MSVHEDASAPAPPTCDSFWEIGYYRSSVTRHEDGKALSGQLISMIQERAELEKAYAHGLRTWANRWREQIGKGPEYGTTESGWTAMLTEAEQVSDLHTEVKDNLLLDVTTSVKKWAKEMYHKPLVGMCRETKQLDDDFRKAQKPWAKRYQKLMKMKKDFHMACKLEKTATNQENNARGDTAMSGDQLKKIQDKVERCRRDVEASRERYEAALSDLNGYNAKYMEDMSEVFARAQEDEGRRMIFFKDTFYQLRRAVDIGAKDRLPEIFEQYRNTIEQADYEKDLKWWSKTHGIDMAMDWPLFEEYSPDFHSISKKDKRGGGSSSDGITLTSIQKNETNAQPITAAETYPAAPTIQNNGGGGGDGGGGGLSRQNPFGDEEWEEYDNPLADDGAEGVPVRALYDYEGEEEDELSFKVGDVFVKLQDKDEQGWCKGRKDGKIGLYPDNYAEEISK